MPDRTVELGAALYTALSSHAGVTAITGPRVYQDVPANAPVPHVSIGDHQADDLGASLVDAQEHTIVVDVWTEGPSPLGCRRLGAAVRAALHERALTLSAGRLVNLRHVGSQYMRDPDGISHHGVLRFRAVTQD